ncbi:LysM peptidoglycan-binding domain-containing protein [Lacihabitans sp. LS3-19]|uniref:LysM peptidoglycan-binding domain-containing protein n=1 Tax=Lacihabitans sp. LS3-19 TaxID=2487335 RepID=UPI0020CBA8E7|nr:LysM peptidoglycan-binding domain-containing protein [Lacihabitans sp. LS3-19]
MKKIFAFLFIIQSFQVIQAQTQLSIPEAPKKIEFANVLIELNPDALKAVNSEITNLLTPQNKFLDQKLERMQWYFPIIERILEEEDVPEDMKYIAVMESSLLPEAISSSNAVGYWQFKEATAKELGIRVDNNQDERKNIYFSTKAAALYMKRNNLIFKNWVSCMLAYNQGVQGASDKIPVDWSFASEIKFDENTPTYLIRALAHRIAFEHRLNRLKDSPRKFIEYPTKGKSLAEIAVELTTDITELRKYNPWLYAPNIPEDKDYNILVISRIEDADEITAKIQKRKDAKSLDIGFPQLKRITMVSTSPDSPIFYEINGKKGILAQSGEEVAQLSAKSKMKIGKFLSYNDMTDKDLTKEGSIYYLQKKNKKAKVPYHTVTGEQTLWDISQMYGVRLKDLLKYNRMKNSQRLQAGRVIWMQKTRPKNQPIEIIQEAIPDKDRYPSKEESKKITEEVVSNTPPVKENYEEVSKPKEVINTKEPKPETKIVNKSIDDGLDIDDDLFESKSTKKTTSTTNVPTETPKAVNTLHRVQRGETLFSIAKKYGLTVDQLRKLNGMSSSDALRADQLLTVKKGGNATTYEEVKTTPTTVKRDEEQTKTAPIVKENNTSSAKFHTVGSGETLYSISKKYGVTVSQIKAWNDLSSNSISLGEKLKVSAGSTYSNTSKINTTTESKEPISNSGSIVHIVKSGETLYSISRKYNVNVADIKKWNNMQTNNISVGNKIIVKK